MLCIALFYSNEYFSLSIYKGNTPEAVKSGDFCEVRVSCFDCWREKDEGSYVPVGNKKKLSEYISLNDLEKVISYARSLYVRDLYNYRYAFTYNDKVFRFISKTQLTDVFPVPAKITLSYTQKLFYRLESPFDFNNMLINSIMSDRINRYAFEQGYKGEALTEYNPCGLFFTVNIFLNSIKGLYVLKKYVKLSIRELCFAVKYPKSYKEGMSVSSILHHIRLTEQKWFRDSCLEEYNHLLNKSQDLKQNSVLEKAEDIVHLSREDALNLIRRESFKEIALSRIKENRRCLSIGKALGTPRLFDVWGNKYVE